RKLGEYQFALVIENHKTIPLGNEERRSAIRFFATSGRVRFPELLAAVNIEAAEFGIGADTIDVAVFENRSGHQAVEPIRFFHLVALAPPEKGSGRLIVRQLEHHWTVVGARDE